MWKLTCKDTLLCKSQTIYGTGHKCQLRVHAWSVNIKHLPRQLVWNCVPDICQFMLVRLSIKYDDDSNKQYNKNIIQHNITKISIATFLLLILHNYYYYLRATSSGFSNLSKCFLAFFMFIKVAADAANEDWISIK